MADFICGTNKTGFHLTGANWERDTLFSSIADFRNVVLILTSNAGSREMSAASIGFSASGGRPEDGGRRSAASKSRAAIERVFSPEFRNRLDAVVQFASLSPEVIERVVDKLLVGLEVNEERCRQLIDQSLMMVTSLAPKIGYEKAAAFAKEAFDSGKTIRELCHDVTIVTPAPAADATVAASEDIDPEPMTTTRRPASDP